MGVDGKPQGESAYDMPCSKTEVELHLQKSLIKAALQSQKRIVASAEQANCDFDLWQADDTFVSAFQLSERGGYICGHLLDFVVGEVEVYLMKLAQSAGMEYLYIAVSRVLS